MQVDQLVQTIEPIIYFALRYLMQNFQKTDIDDTVSFACCRRNNNVYFIVTCKAERGKLRHGGGPESRACR